VTLSRLNRSGAPRRFKVYDLEWYPSDNYEPYELRLVGVYDGSEYKAYRSIDEFLDGELRRENAGITYFAHAGGLADVTFVVDSIIRRPAGFGMEASFSGSSAIICKVERGERCSWTFADSFWLMRDSLSEIGKSLGMEKGGGDYFCPSYPSCGHKKGKCIFWAPFSILKDYNELDCVILYRALRRFEDQLLDLGGELKLTVASCALTLFRSRFLTADIPTNDWINDYARESYTSSRVENLLLGFEGGHTCQDFVLDPPTEGHICTGAHYYDFNSSFPYSMSQPLPGKYAGSSRRWNEDDELALVYAEVAVGDGNIPPIPYKLENRVFFPTGSWKAWFTGVDLQTLLESGVGRIVKLFKVLRFHPFTDFARYVETIYSLRKAATDPFVKLLLKYLLNTGYGKLSESSEKDGLILNRRLPKGCRVVLDRSGMGAYLVERNVDVPHAHVPAASVITARSRRLLTRSIWKVEKLGGWCAYCDTDSNLSSAVLYSSKELGKLKLEGIFDSAVFAAPKLYGMRGRKVEDDGTLARSLTDYVRAKGFRGRDGTKLTLDDFRDIVKGEPFSAPRMLRVKELLRSNDTRPREEMFTKSVKQVERPKRAVEADGIHTRPWTVEEINEPWTKKRESKKRKSRAA
jgi:hypothetical protein